MSPRSPLAWYTPGVSEDPGKPIAEFAVRTAPGYWLVGAALVVLALLRALGIELRPEPTAVWWSQRPFWAVAPALFLLVLVAIFAPAIAPYPAEKVFAALADPEKKRRRFAASREHE